MHLKTQEIGSARVGIDQHGASRTLGDQQFHTSYASIKLALYRLQESQRTGRRGKGQRIGDQRSDCRWRHEG